MSLKIWLPLNGDLVNKGLYPTVITNNGMTYNDNGKIGKCGYFNGSSYVTGSMSYSGFTEWSVSLWFKVNSAPASWSILCNLGKRNGYVNEYTNIVLIGSYLYVVVANGSSYKNNFRTTYTTGIWNHVVFTYKNRTLKLYLNGNLILTDTSTFDPGPNGSTLYSIGGAANNVEKVTGYINDVRIYDHCLSAAEAHELSLALVCHYKLDASISEPSNAFNLPTFNTSADAGGWNHWGQSGASGTRGQNTDKTYIYDKNQTHSHWWANAASATGDYLLYQSPAFAGGYRSLSAIMKEENSKPITESIAYPVWNARDGGAKLNKWTRVISLGDGFYLCQVDGVHQDGSNDLIGFYVKAGYKVYVSQAWLENDKECCSDVLFPLTQVIDSSGYERNGTPNGGILLSADTARYSNSLKFNGTDGYITANSAPLSNSSTEYSISCWFKPTQSHQGTFFSNRTTADLRGIAIFYSNGKLLIDFGSRWTIDNPSIVIGSWNHIVVSAKLNGTSYCYVNGIEIGTNIFSTAPTLANASWFSVAGSQGSSTAVTGNYINGFLSDFRLYATALSVDDVKKLYNLGMKVDNGQNIHGFEFDETTDNLINRSSCTGGIILSDGTIQTHSSWYVTDYIPVTYGKNYLAVGLTTANSGNVYNAFYDSSKTLTRTVLDTTNFEQEITPASGEAYVRLSIRNGSSEFATAGLYEVLNRKILQTGIIGSVLYNEETKAAIYKRGSIHAKEFIEI